MDAPLRGRQRIDRRSLALHRATAEKLREDPALIAIALDNTEHRTRGWPLAALLGRVAGNSKAPSAGDPEPATGGQRADDCAPAVDSLCGRLGTRGALGDL